MVQRGYGTSKFVLFQSDRKSTRLNSSHGYISYAVFCLKKKKNDINSRIIDQTGLVVIHSRWEIETSFTTTSDASVDYSPFSLQPQPSSPHSTAILCPK